jgi:hypothetical protein
MPEQGRHDGTRRERTRGVAGALVVAALCCLAIVGGWSSIVQAQPDPGACTPLAEADASGAEGVIPIQSLAQGNVFDHGPPRSLLLVTSRTDPIAAVIDPAVAPVIANVDLNSNVLVALFIGRWPQEGHHVTIESMRTTDAGVCLTALVAGPSPGQDAADVETYPYHVVSVPLSAFPTASGTIWTVVSSDGAPITSTTFP